jgi:hypothetical protein
VSFQERTKDLEEVSVPLFLERSVSLHMFFVTLTDNYLAYFDPKSESRQERADRLEQEKEAAACNFINPDVKKDEAHDVQHA